MSDKKEMLLRYMGRDSWDRPVYKDETGTLWKDVQPIAGRTPNLCTASNNEFDGEPDTPMNVLKHYEGVRIIYEPGRDVW